MLHRARRWFGPSTSVLQMANVMELGIAYLKTQTWFRLVLGRVGGGSVIMGAHLIGRGSAIEIGNGVIVRWNTRIEAVGCYAGVLFAPRISIGDNTNIEQNCHIVCAERITIGRNVSITPGCVIVDITHPQDKIIDKIGLAPIKTDPVEICDGAFLGAGVTVLPGTRVGRRVVVGANSVVKGDLPDYTIWAGNPARCLREYVQS